MAGQVLVIEDDALYSGAIEAALSDEYSVAVHMDPPSIDEVAQLAPGIVLLDNTLPGVTGCDYLKQLKADERTANIPVIMMSGNHDLSRDADVKTHCSGFLGKPFSLDDLADTVRKVLPA
jgi:CheY-like chemotaxis protein